MNFRKTLTALVISALAVCAFAQAPGANSQAPAAKAAPVAADPADPADSTVANATVVCAKDDTTSKVVKAKATGTNARAIADCGPKVTVVHRTALKQSDTANADVVRKLSDELATLRNQNAGCTTNSWHLFQRADGSVERVCKGLNDEVYRPSQVAVYVPPTPSPAIMHEVNAAQQQVAAAGPQVKSSNTCQALSDGTLEWVKDGKQIPRDVVVVSTSPSNIPSGMTCHTWLDQEVAKVARKVRRSN